MALGLVFDAPVFFGTTASIAVTLAFFGGAAITYWYRNKATLDIKAAAFKTDHGFIVTVTPSVTAGGPWRLNFADTKGAEISIWEMTAGSDNAIDTSEIKDTRDAFPGQPFVNQGETLTGTVMFRFPDGGDTYLLGWGVALNITAKSFPRNGLSWMDRCFVKVPE